MTDTHPTIFVTGATGKLGQLVVEALLARVPASDVVAGVRSTDAEPARRLAAKGVELRVADYDRPETLAAAFAGVERLLLISSNAVGQRLGQHQAVIDAAKTAGVGLIAYTSILHADTSPLPLADEHRPTEAALRASGVPFTLLRNSWYVENYAGAVGVALERGVVLGAAKDGRIAAAARADYAEAAAVVLSTEGHAGRVYELAGDEPFTLRELAASIADASGKEVTYRDLPEDEFREAQVEAGVPERMADMLAHIDAGIAENALDDDGHQLSALVGRPTRPWRELVKAMVASGGARA